VAHAKARAAALGRDAQRAEVITKATICDDESRFFRRDNSVIWCIILMINNV